MKDNNTFSSERLSFYKLFTEKKYRILIPIIQRDYAQGRHTTMEVRNVFLDALSNYLKENKPNRDLDFVYGSLTETEGITNFIPLDGQQRLTTLFLLHWYLYQISENTEKKKEYISFLLKTGKSMFTYETRSSSSEFCDALMNKDIDFENLLDIDKNEEGKNSISKTIENSSWFFLSWKYDPTIKSMLTMLDSIHSKFADKKEYFERLIDTEKPIITFFFLNLKDFKLTDDLYIKMNSRGKPLTSFENFKAKFEQHLEFVTTNRIFKHSFNGAEKDVSLKEYFSYNIDTKWADLFWNYRELVGDKNTYDEELKNFIRVILTNQYAISNGTDDNFEFLLGTDAAKKKDNYTENISYYKYQELNAITVESILYLLDAFDNLVNGNKKIKIHLSESYKFYFDENKIFENALKDESFSKSQERILFHAYIRFLIVNENDRTGIVQWLRFIHNLANNTIIDGSDEISRAIRSIEKLLPNSKDILEHIKKENPQIDFFSSWQVLEEKVKSHLITKTNNWKEKIEDVEKQKCFEGQIGFVLEFSGIFDYYERNNNCDWTKQDDEKYFKNFENYANKAIAVFENKATYDSDYIWERAVLTKGEYALASKQNSITTANRRNLLHTDIVANNIFRDYSWKRLLRIDENLEKRKFIKEVFDDVNFNENNLISSLSQICEESKINDWRKYFISNPELMKYCTKGFIKVDGQNQIYLLSSIYCGANQYFAEMHSYHLWKKNIEPNKNNFYAFKECYYQAVKSIGDNACIVLSNLFHNNIYYEVKIYYGKNTELPNRYEIVFRTSKVENVPDEYGDDIKNILVNLSFEWNEDDASYFFTEEDSNTLMAKLEKLNEEIQNLS